MTGKSSAPPRLPNPADRRASRRNPVQVRLEITERNTVFSARTIDVSRGGLFAATVDLRPVGTLLRIKVIGPKGDPLLAVGVVVRAFDNIPDAELTKGLPNSGLAIALISTSEAWDLFWDDVSGAEDDDEK